MAYYRNYVCKCIMDLQKINILCWQDIVFQIDRQYKRVTVQLLTEPVSLRHIAKLHFLAFLGIDQNELFKFWLRAKVVHTTTSLGYKSFLHNPPFSFPSDINIQCKHGSLPVKRQQSPYQLRVLNNFIAHSLFSNPIIQPFKKVLYIQLLLH